MLRLYSTARYYSTGIKERLMGALKEAMRARNTEQASIIRLLQSELTLLDKKGENTIPENTETAYLGCLQACHDRWSEAIRQYEQIVKQASNVQQREAAERILAKERSELAIIAGFLPAPYEQVELEAKLRALEEAGVKGKGPLMGKLWPLLDPTRISKKRLSQFLDEKIA